MTLNALADLEDPPLPQTWRPPVSPNARKQLQLSYVDYKERQVLQSVTRCYYKVRQVLQSLKVITNERLQSVSAVCFSNAIFSCIIIVNFRK